MHPHIRRYLLQKLFQQQVEVSGLVLYFRKTIFFGHPGSTYTARKTIQVKAGESLRGHYHSIPIVQHSEVPQKITGQLTIAMAYHP